MPGGARRLDDDDLWTRTEHVDVPAVLHAALSGADAATHRAVPPDEHPELPADSLRAIRAAGCAAVAARLLLPPGVITAGVVGAAPAVWWHVSVLCRALPAITHVAVAADPPDPPPPRLVDQLDLAGIGLTRARSAAAAAFGASLVVAAGPAPLAAEDLTTGALLIEAVPGAYPDALRDRFPADGFVLVEPPAVDRADALDTALADALLSAGTANPRNPVG